LPKESPAFVSLVDEVAGLREEVRQLRSELAKRDEEIKRLKDALDKYRRAGKRQAGPFSKGKPKPDPKKPGRKLGEEYGEHERRVVPDRVDEVLAAHLPTCCPDCGGGVCLVRIEHQYQTEVPKIQPKVIQFDVHVGRCPDCGRRPEPSPHSLSGPLSA
jgi:transposase